MATQALESTKRGAQSAPTSKALQNAAGVAATSANFVQHRNVRRRPATQAAALLPHAEQQRARLEAGVRSLEGKAGPKVEAARNAVQARIDAISEAESIQRAEAEREQARVAAAQAQAEAVAREQRAMREAGVEVQEQPQPAPHGSACPGSPSGAGTARARTD